MLRDFRRRAAAAAVLDDLDLCRLLNPGGRQPALVLGLLEIIFEQLPWTRLSPFRGDREPWTVDRGPWTVEDPDPGTVFHGSRSTVHASRIEMIVGRTDEADELFRSARFTRLFSGRKLGKTTLLRHLEQTCDGRELPARLTLHVLLIPIVGVQTEPDFVARLFEAAHRRLGFDPTPELAEGTTGEALIRYLLRFVEQRPTQSLLFLLDDADEFVRAQLDAFEENGDRCLVVRLRTQLGAVTDSTQLPRVRFVFSGYRATATYGGPWAHWGEVLRLEPLRAEVAASLVAAPLARLGIDVSAQADAIAFRCGYQPAVLLRFGEELLRHLEARHGYQEGVAVTAEDVNATFHQRAVQDEIRLVVRATTSGAIKLARRCSPRCCWKSPPCLRVRDCATPPTPSCAACARSTPTPPGWSATLLPTANRSSPSSQFWYGAIFLSNVRTRKARSMLYHTSLTSRCCWPTTRRGRSARRDKPCRIRPSSLQQGEGDGGHRGLLPPRAMADLRQALALPDLRAVVVGSHWPRAVGHRTGGLPDRLGIDPNQVRPAAAALRPPLVEAAQLAVPDAGPEALATLLTVRPPGLPAPLITGGADLLREALDQAHRGEGYEVVGLGRLSRPVLRWWFESVRCLDFVGPASIDLLIRRTSGIPFLVRLLDELLVRPGASEGGVPVEPEDLAAALTAFAERLPDEIALLTTGPPTVRLTNREIDLLRMLETIGAALGYPADLDPARALGEEWSLLYADVWRDQWPGLPFPEPLTDSATDQVAVQSLLLLGLAPGEGNHLAPLLPQRCSYRTANQDSCQLLVVGSW